MELMKHQRAAVSRYVDESVIPLFFAPGTGKTLTACVIAYEKFKKGLIDCVLVVAPNLVDRQWSRQEIPTYIKSGIISDTVVYDMKNSKKPIPYQAGKLNIVTTNIDKFSTANAFVRYVNWALGHKTMIILDEATRIKNPKAARTDRLLHSFNAIEKVGRRIVKNVPQTVARIILTGTPITNGLGDVWSMFEFLQPMYFNRDYYSFRNRYTMLSFLKKDNKVMAAANGSPIQIPLSEEVWVAVKHCKTFEQANSLFGVSLDTYNEIIKQNEYAGSYKHVEELRARIMDTAMFVKIEDVVDMPEQTYNKRMVEMSAEQARIYTEMETELIASFRDTTVSAKNKLVAYLRLQQIASGFVSPDTDDPEDPMKPTWIDETPAKVKQILVDLEEVEGSVIIITHFTMEASKLYDILTAKGYSCCLITGWKRVGSIEDFQNGKYKVLIANIKVLSMGFNLQNSHYMFFYSNTFSLEDRLQVEARIYRKGQTNRCIYYDYISIGSVDMKILAALRSKKTLADYVTNKSAEECLVGWDEDCKECFKDVLF